MREETIKALEKVARIDFTDSTGAEMVCLFNSSKTTEASAQAAIDMLPFDCEETLIMSKDKFEFILGI